MRISIRRIVRSLRSSRSLPGTPIDVDQTATSLNNVRLFALLHSKYGSMIAHRFSVFKSGNYTEWYILHVFRIHENFFARIKRDA